MPAQLTYPGVYIEEVPSGVHTITGVSTSDTAFIDFFSTGPMNQAVRIASLAEFQRVFGGLHPLSEASYAIQQFFLNGGSIAWVVRVASGTTHPATLALAGGTGTTLTADAASPGVWGTNVQVAVDHNTTDPAHLFNLVARQVVNNQQVAIEVYRNLSMDPASSKYALSVVNGSSSLIHLTDAGTKELPKLTGTHTGTDPGDVINAPVSDDFHALAGSASDGDLPGSTNWVGSAGSDALTGGLAALDAIAPSVFNILCMPAVANLTTPKTAMDKVAKYCEDKRAIFIADIPESVKSRGDMVTWIGTNRTGNPRNTSVYFPRLVISDPLNGNRPRNVGPSGTLAGVYARIDSSRGVWKAPAGTEANLRGANLAAQLTDADNGQLNPLGVNALRTFPVFGNVVWGARTEDGADIAASEWKYIPVRRLALYIEESLFQGSKWVVFEPNDEPLWAQIRLNFGAFMQDLFRQGAFQGSSPRDAYFVKCDKETTTQNDINRGVVNILVGFAPLKPAEFVVIKIQQMAGQVQA